MDGLWLPLAAAAMCMSSPAGGPDVSSNEGNGFSGRLENKLSLGYD